MPSNLLRLLLCFPLIVVLVLLTPSIAEGGEAPSATRVRAYAIVVGNNSAGSGQEPLRYAESDAKRVLSVLSELGGYQLQKSALLLSPSPSELWIALDAAQREIALDAKDGRDSVLFFYYSGHARSTALDLGPSRVTLADLRARIEMVPASLRVVVLDACQSGAISQIKGAVAAEDFSTNSIASLDMNGLAIMASSTGAELSQESERLKGSYFTHHFVSGLRGAADADQNGLVTLRESYDYAYHGTLLTSATSAVGMQHATLETDLRGKGDVTLTRPAAAEANLSLPKGLGGSFLVSKGDRVVAEIHKPNGQESIVALPAGRYSVLVRTGKGMLQRCPANLRSRGTTRMSTTDCVVVALEGGTKKGATLSGSSQGAPGSSVPVALLEESGPKWSVEVGFTSRLGSSDAYTRTLETFGYSRDQSFIPLQFHLSAKLYRRVGPHLQLGTSVGRTELDAYTRRTDGASHHSMRWQTWQASALARLDHRISRDRVQFYAEATLGLTRAKSELAEETQMSTSQETQYGYSASGSVGIILMFLENAGLAASFGYGVSPTLKNELGDVHTDAAWTSGLHFRARF